jgi:hypothetical protein
MIEDSCPDRDWKFFSSPPLFEWVPSVLILGIKRPVREADHSPPSSSDVKEFVEVYFSSPNTPSWLGAQLKKRTGITLSLPYECVFDASEIKKHRPSTTVDVNACSCILFRGDVNLWIL